MFDESDHGLSKLHHLSKCGNGVLLRMAFLNVIKALLGAVWPDPKQEVY